MKERFFGPADIQAVSRRAKALFEIAGNDPDLAWYGRYVSLADYQTGGLQKFLNLIRLQGACAACWIPVEAADDVVVALVSEGLRPDRFEYVVSEGDSIARAREILAKYSLGDDLEVTRLGAESSDDDIEAFAEIAVAGGVLPPPTSVMRGEIRRGAFLFARDKASGRVVSCGAGIESFHPTSHRSDHVFWGMLSTLPQWRGRKIALILGAQAMVTLFEDYGFSKFATGVRAGNAGSMALCAKLDMLPGKWCTFVGMDPSSLTSDRVTK